MTPSTLQSFILDQIPLVEALEVSIVRVNRDLAELTAPLDPNRNHLGTAFGGSLSTILILAGYSWLYNAIESRGKKCHVVLQTSRVEYLRPVRETITAIARAPEPAAFEKFLEAYDGKGTGRITIEATIETASGETASGIACKFSGDFVAKSHRA